MIRLEMKNCNMILKYKQLKYQHYHLHRMKNMNILQVKKYYVQIKKLVEQAKFAYFSLEKPLENKQKICWCFKIPRHFP